MLERSASIIESLSAPFRNCAYFNYLRVHRRCHMFPNLISPNGRFTLLSCNPNANYFTVRWVGDGYNRCFIDTRVSGDRVLDLNREEVLQDPHK